MKILTVNFWLGSIHENIDCPTCLPWKNGCPPSFGSDIAPVTRRTPMDGQRAPVANHAPATPGDQTRSGMENMWPLLLVGGIPTQLKNMSSSIGMMIPNIWENRKCSKPPARLVWFLVGEPGFNSHCVQPGCLHYVYKIYSDIVALSKSKTTIPVVLKAVLQWCYPLVI